MENVVNLDVSKYSKDGPFRDPIVRCDSCRALLKRAEVQKVGCCSTCGSRRMRNVLILSEEERKQADEWGIDPLFLALFQEVTNAQ